MTTERRARPRRQALARQSPAIAPAFRWRTRSGGACSRLRRSGPLGQRARRGGRRRAGRGQPVVGAEGLRARNRSRANGHSGRGSLSRGRLRSARAAPIAGSRSGPRRSRGIRAAPPSTSSRPRSKPRSTAARPGPGRCRARSGWRSGDEADRSAEAFSAAAFSAAAFSAAAFSAAAFSAAAFSAAAFSAAAFSAASRSSSSLRGQMLGEALQTRPARRASPRSPPCGGRGSARPSAAG